MNNTAKYMRFSQEELLEEAFLTPQRLAKLRTAPFGYRMADRLPIPEESEAPVVRDIYKLFLEGKSFLEIARRLTEEGLPTPSAVRGQKRCAKTWNPSTIKSILSNRLYTGDRPLPGTGRVLENSHTPVVERTIFEEVRRLMERRTRRRRKGQEHLLSGMAFCGECGAAMSLCRKSTARHYLVCSAWRKKRAEGICSAHSIGESTVIDAVLTQLYVIVKTIKTDELTVLYKEKECTRLMEGLQLRIEENKNALLVLYKDKCRGLVEEEDYLFMAADLKKELAVLESQLESFSELCDERNYSMEARRILYDILNFEKIHKSVLQMLIKRVTVFADGHILIEFNFTEPQENQD